MSQKSTLGLSFDKPRAHSIVPVANFSMPPRSNLKCPQIALLLPAVLPFSRSASSGMSPVSNTLFICANMYG